VPLLVSLSGGESFSDRQRIGSRNYAEDTTKDEIFRQSVYCVMFSGG